MKIAICDDEILFVKQLNNYICINSDSYTECYTSPFELLSKIENGEKYDAIFLDILMDTLDGITLAKTIRKHDKNTFIVFLTSQPQYAVDGYEARAFRYLLKPVSESDIIKVLKEIHEELIPSHKVVLNTAECDIVLPAEDIFFVEANDKDTIFHCTEDTITIRKSLNSTLELLPDQLFFRIHRKYIVNLAHVREFDYFHLTLDCGDTLPISRRNNSAFRKGFTSYIERGIL